MNLGSEFRPLGIAPTRPPTLYFSAWTEATGRELWVSQGDARSTRMLADHVPGPGSSDPGGIAVLPDGTVVLAMTHPTKCRELHRVTPANDRGGPQLIEDANEGPEGYVFGNLAVLGAEAYAAQQRLALRRARAAERSRGRPRAAAGSGRRSPATASGCPDRAAPRATSRS